MVTDPREKKGRSTRGPARGSTRWAHRQISPMSSPSLQVQFDPSSARFGASRSQKRLEDDRLLVGKGRYSDDLEFPGLAWLVVVRSPHAHADISALDLSGCRSAAGVIAAWSMADLRADGVAHIPFPPLFRRAVAYPACRGQGLPRRAAGSGHRRRNRSEERRVGKECRSRWSPYH